MIDFQKLNSATPQKITLSDKNFICIEKIGEGGGSYVFRIVEDIDEIDNAKEFALKVCKFSL